MGVHYREEKASHGGDRRVHQEKTPPNPRVVAVFEASSNQNDYLKTVNKIAEQYKVGAATIQRAEKYADAVDEIAESHGEEIRSQILAGDLGPKIMPTLPPRQPSCCRSTAMT